MASASGETAGSMASPHQPDEQVAGPAGRGAVEQRGQVDGGAV